MVDNESSLVKRASSSFLWNQGAKILEFGLAFVFNIIVARLLGPELQGIYATVTSLGGLVMLIASMGFELLLEKYVAYYSDKPGIFSGLFLHIAKVRGVIIAVLSVLLFIFSDGVAGILGHPEISFLIKLYVPMIFLMGLNAVLRSFFQGLLKLRNVSIATIFNNAFNVVGVYFVLKMGYGISGLIIYTLITFFLTILYLVIRGRKLLKTPQKPPDLKPMYIFGLFTWLIVGLNFALGKQMDVLLLSIFKISSEQIGYYHVGVGFASIINVFVTSGLRGIDTSILSIAYKEGGYELIRKWWSFFAKLTNLISFPILIFAITLREDIIITVFSTEYTTSIQLFCVYMSVCILGNILILNQSLAVLFAIGKERIVFWIRIISTGLNILLAIVLIPMYEIWGAVIATSIATLSHIILEFLFAKIIISGKYPFRFVLEIIFATIVSVAIVYFIPISSGLGLIIKGIVYLFIIILNLYIIKPLKNEDIRFLEKVSSKFVKIGGYFAK